MSGEHWLPKYNPSGAIHCVLKISQTKTSGYSFFFKRIKGNNFLIWLNVCSWYICLKLSLLREEFPWRIRKPNKHCIHNGVNTSCERNSVVEDVRRFICRSLVKSFSSPTSKLKILPIQFCLFTTLEDVYILFSLLESFSSIRWCVL